MLDLKVFGTAEDMARVADRIDRLEGVSQVRLVPATRAGCAVVRADVRHDAADAVLDALWGLDVPETDVTLSHVELVGHPGGRTRQRSLIWADVVGVAGSNARLLGTYIAFMAVAGVVACYGVVDENPILVVGAMAISPDLLPITAIGVGVVGRDARLAGRSLLTLVVGLTVATLVAAAFALFQKQFDLLPAGFEVGAGVLRSLSTVNNETIAVALAAGVAGMLASETRASAGVGVAISVTTIPAAAYAGVAIGVGQIGKAQGALAVLGVNVVMLVIGASITLAIQRRRRMPLDAGTPREHDSR